VNGAVNASKEVTFYYFYLHHSKRKILSNRYHIRNKSMNSWFFGKHSPQNCIENPKSVEEKL